MRREQDGRSRDVHRAVHLARATLGTLGGDVLDNAIHAVYPRGLEMKRATSFIPSVKFVRKFPHAMRHTPTVAARHGLK